LFTDYLTELRDYEDMLGDVAPRDKYRVLKRGINEDLKKNMVVFEGVPYDDFVDHATRIDPALFRKRQEIGKDKKSSSTVSHTTSKAGTLSQSAPSSNDNRRRFRPTSVSKRSSPARKPVIKELRLEISRAECDKRGLCRFCKKPGHVRRDCTELQKVLQAQQPSANAIHVPNIPMHDAFDQLPIPTVNKVRGYAVKDTRSYRDATLGKPKLVAPSWSIDRKKLGEAKKDISNVSNGTETPAPGDDSLPRLEEPLIVRIHINNVEARCLIDTGASGDFVSSQFTFVNRLKHRKLKEPIPIQQAVKGSKPKCNAIATPTLRIGDWNKKTSMYVIHLANYDAIIGLPTLIDIGAQFDLTGNTLKLRESDFSLPLERFQPPARSALAQRRSATASNRLRRQARDSALGRPSVPADHGSPAAFATFEPATFAAFIDDVIEEPISAMPPQFSIYPEVNKDGTPEYYRAIILEKYADVFADKLPAQLPLLRCVNHHIPAEIDQRMAPLYRLPEHHQKALDADIDLKLKAGIIVPTTEIPLATSHMVAKKDPGEMRHVQDLRARNKNTKTRV
jgi:hypothetical protein